MKVDTRLIIFSTVISATCFFNSILIWRALAEHSKGNPHELAKGMGGTECTNCHRRMPDHIPEHHTRVVLPNMDDFSIDPVTMCVSCHEGSEGSHPIAVKPDFPVPADLPLDKKYGISCCTCHYMHGSLKSDHPCCSVSFLDRLLDRDRMRKSFLLRRKNTNGELCKACHETY